MTEGTLFIVSAPSGAGKTSLLKRLLQLDENIRVSVSHTTRPMRPGEKNHVTYHFVSDEEFQRKIKAGELFEWERVYGDACYGSPRDPFEQVPDGHDALLEIGVGGMRRYREAFPEAITIFLAPPSMEAILDRIAKRGGGEENLDNRLRGAMQMVDEVEQYQYIVVNEKALRQGN